MSPKWEVVEVCSGNLSLNDIKTAHGFMRSSSGLRRIITVVSREVVGNLISSNETWLKRFKSRLPPRALNLGIGCLINISRMKGENARSFEKCFSRFCGERVRIGM